MAHLLFLAGLVQLKYLHGVQVVQVVLLAGGIMVRRAVAAEQLTARYQ
jgi:hypothetical protein